MRTTITFHGQELGVDVELLAAAGITAGDSVIVEATDEGVLIRRQTVSEEIDADYAAGRFRRFESDETFLAYLRSIADGDAG
ncbi:MAG: hypothetical protein ACR2GG_10760 [Gemmatimonadaceae bacterium]